MPIDPVIRDPVPEDRDAFIRLWEACLTMHDVATDSSAAGIVWNLAHGSGSGYGLRVASVGSEGIGGFALHSWQANTWSGGTDGCLDTLFVAQGLRGAGLGRALVDDLLALGCERGWRSVFWHVRADNVAARALYDRYGVADGYRRYRVPLAASAPP